MFKIPISEKYQVIAIEWSNYYCLVNEVIKVDKVEKIVWNVRKYFPIILASVWKNIIILWTCLYILVMNLLSRLIK